MTTHTTTSSPSKRHITLSSCSIMMLLKCYILLSLISDPFKSSSSKMAVLSFQLGGMPLASTQRRQQARGDAFVVIRKETISPLLLARPPPTSSFDLDAIEEFEKQLDAAQQSSLSEDDETMNNKEIKEGTITFVVPKELHNSRIDAALSSLLEPPISRSRCGTLVTNGIVSVLEKGAEEPVVMTRKSYKVEAGSEIHLQQDFNEDHETPTKIIPEDIPLNIIYEDEDIIVLNKAADMVVHPAAGNWEGTVVNALAHYLTQVSPFGSGEFVSLEEGGAEIESLGDHEEDEIEVEGTDGEAAATFLRPGIVHRLDKGTTGVLMVAKTKQALAELSKSFADRTVKKTYIAITVGNPGRGVVIDKPIGRHPKHRQRMRVVPDHRNNAYGGRKSKVSNSGSMSLSQMGRRALSRVDTLAFDGKLSVVQVNIETGRTHQIRVHLQDRRTPIYGDDVYGLPDWNKRLSKTRNVNRPLLHAHRLEIDHPTTGERMVFTAPLADDMIQTADTIWPDGRLEQPNLFQ
mmetsp:Transcript_42530/g.62125  ORF Transcript_42530/g.62125 Transcript_42530/m.62125 type:complete len:518 (+) Transcript_42530:147-1700(+)